jgi:hypothetical protein
MFFQLMSHAHQLMMNPMACVGVDVAHQLLLMPVHIVQQIYQQLPMSLWIQ